MLRNKRKITLNLNWIKLNCLELPLCKWFFCLETYISALLSLITNTMFKFKYIYIFYFDIIIKKFWGFDIFAEISVLGIFEYILTNFTMVGWFVRKYVCVNVFMFNYLKTNAFSNKIKLDESSLPRKIVILYQI